MEWVLRIVFFVIIPLSSIYLIYMFIQTMRIWNEVDRIQAGTLQILNNAIERNEKCLSISTTQNSDWQPMSSAPRDGTIIEICNRYGVMPWYGLFYWGKMELGTLVTSEHPDREWISATKPYHSLLDESYCTWRPAPTTDPTQYVDPTNGAQETPEYWGGKKGAWDDLKKKEPTK